MTHTQVMDKEVLNQSKYGIMNKYGNPTQKRVLGATEIWIYDLSQKTTFRGLMSTDVKSSSARGGSSVSAGAYSSYIKITFHNGRVTRWESKGVDNGLRAGGGSGGSIIAVLLLTSLAAALFMSLISSTPTYTY
jgi:hypothetical protein